jgi:RimJ/RimL family protein N-acetyltransferase
VRTGIDGTQVALRAFRRDDVEWHDALPVTSEYDDFGPRPANRSLRRWLHDRLLAEDSGTLLIERTGDRARIGSVSWRTVTWGPSPPSRSLEIGISLVEAARGRGYGTEAQVLVARYLFGETSAHRVQAVTDVANAAEQRALAKAGYTREGVLRGAQWRRGEYHDMVMFAILRSDPGWR